MLNPGATTGLLPQVGLDNPGGPKACAPPAAAGGPHGLCARLNPVSTKGLGANPGLGPGGCVRKLPGLTSAPKGSSSSNKARLPRCWVSSSWSSRDWPGLVLPGRPIGVGRPIGMAGVDAAGPSKLADPWRLCVAGGGVSLAMGKPCGPGNGSAWPWNPGGGIGTGEKPRPMGPLIPGGGIIMLGAGRNPGGNIGSWPMRPGNPGGGGW